MEGIPPALALKRSHLDRELGAALVMLLLSILVSSRVSLIMAGAAISASTLWVGVGAYKLGRFYKRLPEMIELNEAEQELLRHDRLEREEKRQKLIDEARAAREEALSFRQLETTNRFLGVLESDRGSKFQLSTSLDSVWVTHCRDGRIRVWWPDHSPVLRSGVEIVKGNAIWEAEEPKGWYIHRGRERAILTKLSRL